MLASLCHCITTAVALKAECEISRCMAGRYVIRSVEFAKEAEVKEDRKAKGR